jgi:hypothetical protein
MSDCGRNKDGRRLVNTAFNRFPMEPTMSRPSLRTISFAFATLVLAGGAFISTMPAAAAASERTTYCLSGDGQSDCGFMSLAQCEATASGGLGVCNAVSSGPLQRDPDTLFGAPVKFHRTRG